MFKISKSRLQRIEEFINANKSTYDASLDEERTRLESSLYAFLEAAWPYFCKSEEFTPGWHLEAICGHIEIAFDHKIRRLITNVPPRTGKSSVFNIGMIAWGWAVNPKYRFLTLSYSSGLSLRDARIFRNLIRSSWYQSLWGHKFKLVTKSLKRIVNDQGGERLVSSVRGAATGEGADFIVCFPYETAIETQDGLIPIGEIVENKLNVNVLSYNHKTDAMEFKPIENYERTRTKSSQKLIQLELENGLKLKCTLDHPIFAGADRGYIEAKQLKVGDTVYTL